MIRVDPWGLAWTTADFVAWYWIGFGRTVDLASVGLLYAYQQAVRQEVRDFERWAMRDLVAKAKQSCRGGGYGYIVRSTYEDHSRIHVGGNGTDASESPLNPLYSIGDHQFDRSSECAARVYCCKKKMKYRCVRKYGFVDPFTHPLGDHIPDFGWVYDITAHWQTQDDGEVSW